MLTNLYATVQQWIPEKSRVLDLGTGDGSFLASLIKQGRVQGEGVEKDPEMVARCIEKGLIVHQGDILDGLDQYEDGAFDYSLLLGTFQELVSPELILREAFRVSRRILIAYTNFSFWKGRLQFMFTGRSPVTTSMPFRWYETPNLHFFSIFDFQDFLRAMKFHDLKSAYFNSRGRISVLPNLRAEQALTLLTNENLP